MSYKPGFYEPEEEEKKSFMDEFESAPKHVKSSCPVKKFIVLGAIAGIGALIIKWVKD